MRRRNRRGLGRTVRNTAISVLVLLVLFVGAGVAYVLFVGGTDTDAKNVQPSTAPDTGLPKPHTPAPNAPESAGLESIFTPVKSGQNTSMIVKTLPGSTCSINFTYNNTASKDSGLIPKKADEYGSVSWSWTVDSSVPAGKWPAKVTCVYGKKSAIVVGNIEVTK